jgi:hypothetical protein
MQMEDMAMDGMADEELLKLEQKLGLASAPQVQTQSVPQVNTDVDAQLAELEKRIENQQQG